MQPTEPDPLKEALRIVNLADQRGLQVRLLGGLAFHALAPSWRARIDRSGRDIDLATRARDRQALGQLMAELGYAGDRRYNAVHGHKQLYFVDSERDRPVDVLVERFEMAHAFDFGDRLKSSMPTLPMAELLLSKLQVVKINRKDLLDALILLYERPLTLDDQGINVGRIVEITARDWGWWRTVTGNLAHLVVFAREAKTLDELDTGRPHPYDANAQINELSARIAEAGKSVAWRLRSHLGDRVPWYMEPEEISH